MKIALLHFYLATASGDPRMVLSIAKELKNQGHNVKVYCSEFDSSFLPNLHEGLSVKIVPPKKPLNSVLGATTLFGKIIERIRRNRLYTDSAYRIEKELDPDFDFIFCENDYTYKAGALYKRKHPNAKVVWIMNNPPFYHSKKKNFISNLLSSSLAFYESIVMKKFSKWIDWVIVYDKSYKKGAEALGYHAKLIGNPLDFDYFYSPVKEISPNQDIHLLAAGALSPFRRFEDAITATALLRKQGYAVRLTIVCKDYWSDKSYRLRFEKHIEDSGVANFIDARFSGVDEEEMISLLKTSHISVVPNNARVWIVTACEAMASGLPVVISDATAMTDIFENEKSALFFKSANPDEIASCIKRLIDDPVLYSKIALSGQQYVKEHLNFSEFAKEIIREPVIS